MKKFRKTNTDYTKLNRIIFFRGLGIMLGAVSAVLLLRAMTRGHLADTIVLWIAHIFSLNEDQADMIYFKAVTANMQFILGIVIIIFVFLLFYMLLYSYKRYFDEVLSGIDKLMEDGDAISLSPELKTVEHKLNYAKQTLKTQADEARKTERQKNELVVYLAHDIKTPLTSVIGYLSLLDENPDMPDDKKLKYIHTAWEKANRLRILVNEFFEITRNHSEELYPQLSACKKRIENNVGEDISVYGDSEKLARVFNNILKNAIAYSEDESVISVFAEEFPEKTVIRFENRGEIPDDKLSLIFDKFYRLSSTRQSETGGSGLGLAIARDIVTLHGGRIKAESSNGLTSFVIELPSMREELTMAP